MRFLSTFGRLPNARLNLALMVASGLAEGLSLAMFVPLLQRLMGGETDAAAWPYGQITAFLARHGLPTGPLVLLATITGLAFAALALGYYQRKMLVRSKRQYVRRIRDLTVERLMRSKWEHIARQSQGETINLLVTECDRAGNALGYEMMAAATALLIAIYVAFSSALSWKLMLISVAFGALAALVLRPLTARAKRLGDITNEANRDYSFYNVDYLRNLKLIKAVAGESIAAASLARRSAQIYRVVFDIEVNATQVYFLIQALPVALIVIVIAAGSEAFDVPPALMLVFLLFVARIAPRVGQFQQQYQSYLVTSPAIEVVDQALAASVDAAEDVHPNGLRFERLTTGISLDQVIYTYDEGNGPVLDGVSLAIRNKQMVAIVGPSGGGKSTLIDIVAGLRRPTAGRVMVDGIDLSAIDLLSWRRRIGFVTQDTFIFNDTMRANFAFLHPEATEAEIHRALDIAQLAPLVELLPEGLDTMLGEGGVRLSGGQRQRIALARALVGRPEILLLDEATSNLDNESERYIQRAIEAIAHTMTIVVIAHRLSTVRRADVIYVIENGRVVEFGDYDQLLARNGRFAALHEAQFA